MKRLIGSTSSHFPESAVAASGRSGSASVLTGSKRGRGTGAAALVAIVFGLMLSLIMVPVASADECPNSRIRFLTSSSGLPDCRAYEMVTPPYKQGFSTVLSSFTDAGVVAYSSQGIFADNQQGYLVSRYRATRSAMGWITTSLSAPGTFIGAPDLYAVAVENQSVDLRRWLSLMGRRDVPGDPLGYWLLDVDGAVTRIGDAAGVGPTPFLVGVSDDLSHIVFNYGSSGAAYYTALWEYVGTGNAGPPRAVTVDNQGQPSLFETCLNDVSADGRVIVYTAGCNGGLRRLAARVGGSAKVAVSGSECTRSPGDPGGACNGFSAAEFVGGSADGSRVFFTTSQQLVNGDVDSTSDLYACDIPAGVPAPVGAANPCASLTQVSGSASNAQVDHVVAVSEDGSRVYFVASGVLADNLGLGDVGAGAGALNLYMWERDSAHPAGQTRFVSRLGGNDLTRAQMTPDGRYLLFSTANSLVTTGPSADTDGVSDVYRYDATTKAVVRISTSVPGGGGNAGLDASISETSSMTSDGSTVAFDTAEGLSGSDANGVTDVYAWHDGHVSQISTSGAAVAVGGGGSVARISPSGRDIFFTTNAPVLDSDRDVITDIYDARIGGGFAPAKVKPPCFECQGSPTPPPALSGPGSPDSSDSGNVKLGKRSSISLKRVSAKSRKAAARSGVLPISVKSNSAGKLSVSARASMGRVARKTVRLRKAGTVKIRLSLSDAARQRLRNGNSLRITLTVTKKGTFPRSSSVLLPGASS